MISLFCSANRPKLWPFLFDTLSKNTVEYEIIMVGDNNPNFTLPDNVTYIYSEVKPAQCYHIASTHCSGDYMMSINDDYYFMENALDHMMDTFDYVYEPHNVIVSALYTRHDMYLYHNPDSPVLPLGGMLMEKELWKKTKGIDINFVGLYWDLDITMRIISEFGGHVAVCRKALMSDNLESLYKGEHTEWGRLHAREYRDWKLFNTLWSKTPNVSMGEHLNVNVKDKRGRPVELYQNREDILTVSQGPKSRWK